MRSRLTIKRALLLFALSAAPPIFGGCSTSESFLSSGPKPRVEDCALIQQATPAKFVCGDGKTYTAVQLSDIRTGKATK